MARRPFLESLCFAWKGLVWAWRTQGNLRRHTLAAVLAVGLARWLKLSAAEQALVVLTVALVLITELANTALEALVDLYKRTYHPLAKVAKDVAAAAVLVAAFAALIVGLMILGPPLLRLWP
ncbi:MAG: diacylglycerol kinase [bacterium]|jgi:diacylglycerol kinase